MRTRWVTCLLVATGLVPARALGAELTLDRVRGAHFQVDGVVGRRVAVNVDQWLLPAPVANPGMLEIFRQRDRQPPPNLVPWAGEFVGKYLISAIQALRMTDRDDLRKRVKTVVETLMDSQAEDGYLGPFPKNVRLLANWDLWGHYHCMLALMMWYEDTGDGRAIETCRRAADLICKTFLDTDKRVYDAGSHEMNMSVIHGLGRLYEITRESRYLRMMRAIEKDWERAGDYLRTGVAGVPFYRTPKPRWESLHCLQGLVELYRITGDAKYRRAYENHWRSIARFDRRNTGGFSSGEQATGNPYAPTAIETCCTTAWMALSVDMLRLTGEATVADELELSLLNGSIGAQHPSGRWWTYNTPMGGRREASADTIVFQARAGTPELNCCAVNAPRGLGMLSEWGTMQDADGLIVNYYGPGRVSLKLADGTPLTITQAGDYPVGDRMKITVSPTAARRFKLRLRIPRWSARTTVQLNGKAVDEATPGQYLSLDREWKSGDAIDICFDMRLRHTVGDAQQAGRVSLYRGPLLLAYDQRYNPFDADAIPVIDLNHLAPRRVATDEKAPRPGAAVLRPWLLLDVKGRDGRTLRLCDFASAGAAGTHYRSWLAAENAPPPVAVSEEPFDNAAVAPGAILFRWRGPRRKSQRLTAYRFVVADEPTLAEPVLAIDGITRNAYILDEKQAEKLKPGRPYWWQVIARNAHGETTSAAPASRFTVDASQPRQSAAALTLLKEGPHGEVVAAAFAGDAKPRYGKLVEATGASPAEGIDGKSGGAIALNGDKSKLEYAIEEFPDADYSLSVWVRVEQFPQGRLGQIFSAWATGMDDPLRVCVANGKLFARIEAGRSFSTSGVPVETRRWMHVAAVKAGTELTLYVDGEPRATADVPEFIYSTARTVAVGANPNFGGNEYLAAAFADFALYARALSATEVKERHKRSATR